MPFTQERLRDLLVEYKALIDTADSIIADATTRELNGQGLQAKYVQLVKDVERLGRCHRHFFALEWRDLNRNWKRNQRAAQKQAAKRRAQGVVPRGDFEGIRGDYVPRGILALSPEQQKEDEVYRRFCAGQEETGDASSEADLVPLPPAADQEERDRLRCQFDLGLPGPPTDEQFAKWQTAKLGGL